MAQGVWQRSHNQQQQMQEEEGRYVCLSHFTPPLPLSFKCAIKTLFGNSTNTAI
jgi:hypothetical protein